MPSPARTRPDRYPAPRVRSVADLPRGLEGEELPPPPALLHVSTRQLLAALRPLEWVRALPADLPGLRFHPLGYGMHLGVPCCGPAPGDAICYPLGPGPDDDPATFSCVCLLEPERIEGQEAA